MKKYRYEIDLFDAYWNSERADKELKGAVHIETAIDYKGKTITVFAFYPDEEVTGEQNEK